MSSIIKAILYILYAIVSVSLKAYFVSILPVHIAVKIVLGIIVIFGGAATIIVDWAIVTLIGKIINIMNLLNDSRNLHGI